MHILMLSLLGCLQEEAPDPKVLMAQSCGAGKPKACFNLGTDHLNAPTPRYSEARKLFSTGCGVHHTASCNALGTLVRDARGGPKDMVRAARLFQTACEPPPTKKDAPKPSRQGCINLAEVLREGDGTDQDLERSAALYRIQCEHTSSFPKACTALAEMVRIGDGVEKKNVEEADMLLAKACDAGFPKACAALADVLVETRGRKAKENLLQAVELYDKACGIDANHGCFELAKLHHDQKAPEANYEQAGEYYSLVCRVDTSRGCYDLAELMTEALVESREGEKEALYKLSCESGFSEACDKR